MSTPREPAKRQLGVGVRGALVSWLDQPLSEGWTTGIEPATSGTTIRRSNQLSYAHHQCKLGLKTKGRQEARKACFLAYSRPWRARGAGAEESGRSGLRARTQGTSPRCQRRSKIAHSWRVKMSHFDGR